MSNKLVKLGSLKGPKGDPGFNIRGEINAIADLDFMASPDNSNYPRINDAWVLNPAYDDSLSNKEEKNGAVWVYRGEDYEYREGAISYGQFEYVTNLRGPKGEVSQNIHFAATYNDFVTVDYYNETMKIGDAVIDNGEADFTRMGNMYKIIDISPSEDTTLQNQGKWIEATDLNQIKQNSQVIVVSKDSDNEYYAMEKEADSSYEEINKNCIFLDPGLWNVDDAKFAIYYFNSSGLPNNGLYNRFEFLVKVDGSNIYYTNLEEGWTNCIFVRLNPACEVPSWDYNWGQTADLNVPVSLLETNMLTITGWSQNEYRWGKYTQESSSTRKIIAVNISEHIGRLEDGKLCIENTTGISDLSIFFLRYLDTSTRQFSFYDTSYSNNASIYCVKDANIKIGPGDENNEFIFDSNGYFKNKDTSKWIGVYKKQDWRCYDTDPTKNNIKGQTFTVFEYVPANLLVPSNPKVTIDTNNIISINSVKPNIYYGGKNIEIVDQTTINSVGYIWDKEKKSFAAGENINIVTGEYSFAEGDGTEATGNYSHAEGNLSKSTGIISHAEGNQTIASGENSHSEGYKTIASGKSSHAEGIGSEAVGESSHAEGCHNIDENGNPTMPIYKVRQDAEDNTKYYIDSDFQGADGGDGMFYLKHGMTFLYNKNYYYVTEVFYNDDNNDSPIAFRLNQTVGKTDTNSFDITLILGKSVGKASHIEGNNTIAYGHYAHAEGNSTRAAGANSHTEGSETSAIGISSHAEGRTNAAIGDGSHVEGTNTTSLGLYSHAEGASNTAVGYASHVEGIRNRANNNYEHAEGKFNISNTGIGEENQTISSIGIGHYTGGTESPYNEEFAVRKNAVEVMHNGDVYIHGIGDYDGTNSVVEEGEVKAKTLQKVVEELSNGASSNITIATTDELGVIKVGENLNITNEGVLTAKGYSWDDETNTMTITSNSGILGKINAEGGFFETSDARKKDIQGELSLDKAYDFIRNCEPILYNLKGSDKTQIGLIAQEVREFFPEIVNKDSEGYLSLDYAKLTVIMLRVLKDLIDKK